MGKFTYNVTFTDSDGEHVAISEPMNFHAQLFDGNRINYLDKVLVVVCIYHEMTGYPAASCTLEYS